MDKRNFSVEAILKKDDYYLYLHFNLELDINEPNKHIETITSFITNGELLPPNNDFYMLKNKYDELLPIPYYDSVDYIDNISIELIK